MKRSPYLVALGALLLLGGLIWTAQGLGLIGPGTGAGAESGTTVWAVLGPVIALGGLALLIWPPRRR
ncbi:hypothetical protein [Humibacillus xanthopallidus]|uniref:Uncharacterized protein n=1 Tax=Humibacillus xanthopallidus TaxID=412689 RepID=A0A543H8G9_9MICO|nr:hypothetical protein [Humibacillus xanthopallidus]TQM54646.1 hypothetical protein FBY41_4684 [Humibacillus xanthopallidus]